MTETGSRSRQVAAAPDSLAQYLRQIGRHPLLTPAEEVTLAKRIEGGDVTANNRMVESNLRLVVAVARRYAHRDVPLLDLIQEGTLGLIRAAERFDWRRGTRFSTYAMWWIRQGVERAVFNQADPIKVPIHVHERRRRLARAEQTLELELTRTVTPLEQVLLRLRPAQRRVIELRFGLRGDERSTEEAAELLDISPGQVRALERGAQRRLRELASPVELRPAA